MRLKEWMQKQRWNAVSMGEATNICPHTLRTYMAGYDMPLRTAKRLVEFTGGAVNYEDLQPTKTAAYKRKKNTDTKSPIQVEHIA
jgi:hypothetical protein